MEGHLKQSIPSLSRTVTPLNLHLHLPYRDVRTLIWSHLNALDREMIRMAHNSKRSMQVTGPFLTLAVKERHIELVRWIITSQFNGRFVDYLLCRKTHDVYYDECDDQHEEGYWIGEELARQGDVQTLSWLLECPGGMRIDTELLWQAASAHGQLAFAQWLEGEESLVSSPFHHCFFAALAASGGHLPILQWFREQGWEIEEEASEAAAGRGHLHILVWLAANDYPFSRDAYTAALHTGRVSVLDWLANYLDYYPAHIDYMVTAVKSMQLPSIIWLRNHGCPWDASIYEMANANRQVYEENGILPWLVKNGVPQK